MIVINPLRRPYSVMAPEPDTILLEPRPGFERINNEFCKLVEDRIRGQPYKGGAYLNPSDVATMKIVFDQHAEAGFWAPADDNRRCLLEEFLSDIETEVNNQNLCKQRLDECHCPEIKDAYGTSVGYSRLLQWLVYEGLFYNKAFRDASGNDLFQNLRCVPVIVICFLT